jgi:hypothetical protein
MHCKLFIPSLADARAAPPARVCVAAGSCGCECEKACVRDARAGRLCDGVGIMHSHMQEENKRNLKIRRIQHSLQKDDGLLRCSRERF